MQMSELKKLCRGDILNRYLKRERQIVDHYELGEYLGEGSFSVVRSAKNKATGVQEAVKMIKIDKDNKLLLRKIINEVEILASFSYKYILKFSNFFVH